MAQSDEDWKSDSYSETILLGHSVFLSCTTAKRLGVGPRGSFDRMQKEH